MKVDLSHGVLFGEIARLHASHDADDSERVFAVHIVKLRADGAAVRPIFARHELVHQHNARRIRPVTVSKISPGEERDAHRLKITTIDSVPTRHWRKFPGRQRTALN